MFKPDRLVGATSRKPYVKARVQAADDDGETFVVTMFAFDPSACAALLALDAGDTVAAAGNLTPKLWKGRDGATTIGIKLMARQVLTVYNAAHKQAASVELPPAVPDESGATPDPVS